MKIKWNFGTVDLKPYKPDFRAIMRDLAKLSELMGQQWVDTSTHYKVAKKVVSAINNPIIEIDTDYRWELLEEDYEILKHNGGIWLSDYIPNLNEICCLACNHILYWDRCEYNPNKKKDNEHD